MLGCLQAEFESGAVLIWSRSTSQSSCGLGVGWGGGGGVGGGGGGVGLNLYMYSPLNVSGRTLNKIQSMPSGRF